MKSIKGTKTEQNLLKSYAGESQARNRYTYFASTAKKEGYILISQIFSETADQEKEHAKRFFSFLEGGMVEITASYPAGALGSTKQNLEASIAGEHGEWTELYPEFARVAEEEGFHLIAAVYQAISIAEKRHEERYKNLLRKVRMGTSFKQKQPVVWRCLNCGFIYEGAEAPLKCPACDHPQSYFEVFHEVV